MTPDPTTPEGRQELRELISHVLDHIDALTAERDAMAVTIKRIWQALGIETYEQAGGKTISELVVDQAARIKELEAAQAWQPIESVPPGVEVLLYCPARHFTNPERIEMGYGDNGAGSHHSWATMWQPKPPFPRPSP